jgi:CheY-like chemotaxis protein
VLERLATLDARPPVVAYSNRDIGEAEEAKLKSYAETFTVKQALSSEEILDLSCLYLHQDLAGLGEERRQLLVRRQQRDPQLEGRSVLIIDDDIRNIFTLTSVLEQHGINVVFAENGRDGIQKLRDTKAIDVALVDVMMPEMDGYEVMREIRRDPAYGALPVVAVTAKAMQGDRKKCIEAGASDYLAKPVDVSQLLATLRAWVVQ